MNLLVDGKPSVLAMLSGSSLAILGALLFISCPRLTAQSVPAENHSSGARISPLSSSAPATLASVPDYTFCPDDLVSVSAYDAPDITGEYRISSTGQMTLPLLPEAILAAGLTPGQLADTISQNYRQAGILSHPRITVAVKESRVHSIAIGGAVKMPQIYTLLGKSTLLDVLSQSQGLADDAGTIATVTRGAMALTALKQTGGCATLDKAPSCQSTFNVDLNRLLESADPAANVDLYPGDRVTVRRAGIVYVEGAVNRPGGFPLKAGQEDMTVLKALALAEDLKPTASRKNVMIIRKDPAETNGRTEIPVNLKDILAGRGLDPALRADDILYVADSAAGRAWRRGAEAAITAATWGFIYR
jgi:polysaccharide biosynthesis/export protein